MNKCSRKVWVPYDRMARLRFVYKSPQGFMVEGSVVWAIQTTPAEHDYIWESNPIRVSGSL